MIEWKYFSVLHLIFLLHNRLLLLVDISEEIEVGEQDEEDCRISNNDLKTFSFVRFRDQTAKPKSYCGHNLGITAVVIHRQQPVHEDEDELDHLQSGQVPAHHQLVISYKPTHDTHLVELETKVHEVFTVTFKTLCKRSDGMSGIIKNLC